jgi:hypothetical protein
MAKHYSRKGRSQSKSRTMRRAQRGGDLAGNPPSAWGWGLGTLGNGWTQFTNSLTLMPGQNAGTIQSNDIVPVGNINAQNAQGIMKPLTGGKKRRRNKRSVRRGGAWGAVANQAIVPGTLVAMNQFFGKSRKNRKNL